MKIITWTSLLKTFSTSFDNEIQNRLDILNRLNEKTGRPKYEVSYYGTASQRRELEQNGESERILSDLDEEILKRQNELNRTIINPTVKYYRINQQR